MLTFYGCLLSRFYGIYSGLRSVLSNHDYRIDLHFVIKIADFGLSENIYDRSYVRKGKDEGGKLPIKWMALESLTDLVFSEKTDVVS